MEVKMKDRQLWCFVILMVVSMATALADPPPLGDNGLPPSVGQTYDIQLMVGPLTNLPETFDWRDHGMVTPARDQGLCAGSWAFAAIGVVESKLLLRYGTEPDLSEQQLLACGSPADELLGCCGGNLLGLEYAAGIVLDEESCTGYVDYNTVCPLTTSQDCSALAPCAQEKATLADSLYTVDASDVEQVKASVYFDGPAYLRFDVYEDFYYHWASSKKNYIHTSGSAQDHGHAVLLIGWDDTREAWLCKNSWGETGAHGDGTFWLSWNGPESGDLDLEVANLRPQTCSDVDLVPDRCMGVGAQYHAVGAAISSSSECAYWSASDLGHPPAQGESYWVLSHALHGSGWGSSARVVFDFKLEQESGWQEQTSQGVVILVVEGEQDDGDPEPIPALVSSTKRYGPYYSSPPGGDYLTIEVPVDPCFGVVRSTLLWNGWGQIKHRRTCIVTDSE
jgi:hypothetical protein